MSYTPVQNRFWSDGWVRQLNALDRYLFLYLLTNGRAKLTGIYELPLDMMAAESGIDERDLRLSMLQRLEPKVYYKEGWVIMVNYHKHRVGGGHKYNQGVKANYEELPPKIREIAKDLGYPMDTLSIHYSHFPTRIDKNKLYTPAANASDEIEESILEDEAPTRSKKPAKYPHSKEVFALWGEYPKHWEDMKEVKQRAAAEDLYNELGIEEIKNCLSFLKKHMEEDFCPKIYSPADLREKYPKLEAYSNKT